MEILVLKTIIKKNQTNKGKKNLKTGLSSRIEN